MCIASGPSLTEADCDYVRGRVPAITVNASFRRAPWADACYAADLQFWDQYIEEIRKHYRGELWTQDPSAAKKHQLFHVERAFGRGLSRKPGTVNTGGNSGYQALHLAINWGATRVLLLGYDMQLTGGRCHWHGRHAGGLRGPVGFRFWMRSFGYLAEDLKGMGVEVVNCSRATALEVFPRMTIEEALPLPKV